MEEIRSMLEALIGDFTYYLEECESFTDDYTNDDIAYLMIGIEMRKHEISDLYDKLRNLYVEEEEDVENNQL